MAMSKGGGVGVGGVMLTATCKEGLHVACIQTRMNRPVNPDGSHIKHGGV